MVTVNPLIVPFAMTAIAGSTTVATLLLMVLAVVEPDIPKAVDGEAMVIVAALLVADAHAPLVTMAL